MRTLDTPSGPLGRPSGRRLRRPYPLHHSHCTDSLERRVSPLSAFSFRLSRAHPAPTAPSAVHGRCALPVVTALALTLATACGPTRAPASATARLRPMRASTPSTGCWRTARPLLSDSVAAAGSDEQWSPQLTCRRSDRPLFEAGRAAREAPPPSCHPLDSIAQCLVFDPIVQAWFLAAKRGEHLLLDARADRSRRPARQAARAPHTSKPSRPCHRSRSACQSAGCTECRCRGRQHCPSVSRARTIGSMATLHLCARSWTRSFDMPQRRARSGGADRYRIDRLG